MPLQDIFKGSKKLLALAPRTGMVLVVCFSALTKSSIELQLNAFSMPFTMPVSNIFAVLVLIDTLLGIILPNYILGKEPEAICNKCDGNLHTVSRVMRCETCGKSYTIK